MADVTAWGTYLEHNEGGHFKFYKVVYTDSGLLVIHYGRLGTAGQYQIKQGAASTLKREGLRKVAEKTSKGYEVKNDEVQFTLSSTDIEWALEKNEPKRLIVRFDQALTQPMFAGEKDTVVAIYDAFLERSNALMDKAAKGGDFDSVMSDFDDLRKVWQEIEDKHSLTATTLATTKAMLVKGMMSGSFS